MTNWRLLELTAEGGAANLAVDEAILEAMAGGEAPPTLRFYSWTGNWLSIGSAESAADLDLDACREAGIGVVRRHSGGAAVLHHSQLAYTVVLPDRHPLMAGPLLDSYRRLAPALLEALAMLDVRGHAADPDEANLWKRQEDRRWKAACLASLVPFEILAGGKKIVANAQLRRRGVVMHHGVVLLDFDPRLASRFITVTTPADREELRQYLSAKVGSLREATASPVSLHQAAVALRRGFAHGLGVELAPGELSDLEVHLAAGLLAGKYGTQTWTFRR